MFYGLKFDLSAIVCCYSLFIFLSIIPFHLKHTNVYQKVLKIIFVVSSAIAISGNLLDCGYFKFTFSRTTADIFNVLGEGSDFFTLLPQYIVDFWYLFLIWIFLIVSSLLFFNKTKVVIKSDDRIKNLYFIYIKDFFIFIIIGALSVIGFRGGLQLRPVSIMNAGNYTSSKNSALVLNTPFSIIKTLGKSKIKDIKYFDDKTLDTIFSPVHNYYRKNKVVKKNNVVVLILESFGKEYIGELNKANNDNNYKGYTPFLDSLIKESIVFTNAYANGKRSIEAIPAALAGIPSLMNDAYITSAYAGNNINSLATILKTKGYYSAFYHGGTNGTMGFDDFIKHSGFDNYFGRTEYNNEKDFDGKWGIFDEEFLQFVANKFDKCPKPFVSGIFTLSSHHPYTIPKKYTGKFQKGILPIHQSIEYADFSLRKFFKTMLQKPWFDSTLFVIVADHTSESFYPQYQTRSGMYEIPIIFYQHNSKLKGKCETVAEQSDIMPSILDYLNYDKPFVAFGESVFDSSSFHFAVNYTNETYQLIYKNYSFVFDGKSAVAMYDINKDRFLKNNIIGSIPETQKEIERKLKAIIQSFNQRVMKNKMIAK